MATIRVRDWTKEQIEEIREAESHSSHDSVIKALLKDRELAKFAGAAVTTEEKDAEKEEETPAEPTDKLFDNLTVLSELVSADNGVLFFWCPNCSNEVAHVVTENPVSMSVFEVECQRCLTRLDQHAIVCIEIGYPIEQRTVEETLHDDLKKCVIDYWDRALVRLADGSFNDDVDPESLVTQFDTYFREFGWEWPTDVPVVGLEVGRTYRNEATGERFEVLEASSGNHDGLNDYRVQKRTADGSETEEAEVIEANTITNLVLSRNLYLDGYQ
ncbi:hypothetical protein [Halorussus salinisoli]|uniref:hypothetical protein n=1 Tax=Halorussus salinisoli TaxID=2558242 RepID=UPI0010C1BC76|nr:hypothetical protein [Halorussus salinisoli]